MEIVGKINHKNCKNYNDNIHKEIVKQVNFDCLDYIVRFNVFFGSYYVVELDNVYVIVVSFEKYNRYYKDHIKKIPQFDYYDQDKLYDLFVKIDKYKGDVE